MSATAADVLWARMQLGAYYRYNRFGALETLGFAGWERCAHSRCFQHLLALAMQPVSGVRLWQVRS